MIPAPRRTRVLEGFPGRSTIYWRYRFRERYEATAHANLAAALQELTA
ncbi:MAG TPA: hypothetical protein VFU13_08870 [Steroidobacteraceae bacterium]|nr:hypothetical protein [Steroidobacteraceae bacterium]